MRSISIGMITMSCHHTYELGNHVRKRALRKQFRISSHGTQNIQSDN